MALLFLGGPVLQGFSEALMIGIVAGTYSSIYIASALVLWWHKGQRPKTGSQVVVQTQNVKERD